MKRLKFSGTKIKKFAAVGLLAVTMLGLSTMFLQSKAQASVSFGGPFNCDNNAVIAGGANSTSAVINATNNGTSCKVNGTTYSSSAASIQHIYSYAGISSSDIQNLGTTAVAGSVNKNGNVYVGNQLVATGAWTAGRQVTSNEKSCSTPRNWGGTTFYTRYPSCSFGSNSLTAYVVMQNGSFKFAILSACGNPVRAASIAPANGMLACTQLLATPGTVESNGDQSFTFVSNATATNANISKYAFGFGNGSSQTINSSSTSVTSEQQTYAPGTYTIQVQVSGTAKNVYTTAPSSNGCTTNITIPPLQQTGTLVCDGLQLNEIGSTDTNTGAVTYDLTAQATASNANITDYVFDFGNGATQTVNTNANNATSEHVTFAAGESFPSIFVTVYGTGQNGTALTAGGASSSCSTNLVVPAQTCATGSKSSTCQPTCTAPNGQTYPAGSANCEVCKYNSQISANSTSCVPPATPTTPTTPTTPAPKELVNTGAGNIIGLFVGSSIAGMALYRFFLGRRFAR